MVPFKGKRLLVSLSKAEKILVIYVNNQAGAELFIAKYQDPDHNQQELLAANHTDNRTDSN